MRISSFVWVSWARGANLLSTMLLVAVASNLLPAKDFGYFTIAAASVLLGAQLLLMGGATALLKSFAITGWRGAERGVLLGGVLYFLAVAACLAPLFFIALRFAGAETYGLFPINFWASLFLWATGLSLQSIAAESYRGLGSIFYASAFSGGLSLITPFTVWVLSGGLNSVSSIVLIAAVVNITIGIASIVRLLLQLRGEWRVSLPSAAFVRLSVMLGGMAILQSFMSQADLFLVGYIFGPIEAGQYGVAVRLVALVGAPLVAMNAVVQGQLVNISSKRSGAEMSRIRRHYAWALLISVGIFLFLIVFGESIVSDIFNTNSRNVYVIFLILGVGQIINVGCGPGAIIMQFNGHERSLLILLFGCSITAIVVTLSGANLINTYWVAGIFSLNIAVQNLFFLFYCNRVVGIKSSISLRKA